ncbi:hypothetical protein GQ457_01G029650 [Hibiscus cannabinus]
MKVRPDPKHELPYPSDLHQQSGDALVRALLFELKAFLQCTVQGLITIHSHIPHEIILFLVGTPSSKVIREITECLGMERLQCTKPTVVVYA